MPIPEKDLKKLRGQFLQLVNDNDKFQFLQDIYVKKLYNRILSSSEYEFIFGISYDVIINSLISINLIDHKYCKDCHSVLHLKNFYKLKSGIFEPACKLCKNKRSQKNYSENKERHKKLCRGWYDKNIEKVKLYSSDYFQQNKERLSIKHKDWERNNRDRVNELHRNWYNLNQDKLNSIKKRIRRTFSMRIWKALKFRTEFREMKMIFGYTTDELISHLESKFQNGMTWKNYGRWHIDHIRPVCSFKYESITDPEFIECWSLNNLQPLWAADNWSKGGKYDPNN